MKRWTVALLLFCSCGFAPEANAQVLRNAFENMLTGVVTMPIPRALGPVVTLAQNADSLAVSGLETYVGIRERQLRLQQCGANRQRAAQIERQLRAIARLKAALNRIKRKRARDARKAKEDGWDPFVGRMAVQGPLNIPGMNNFILLDDGFGDMPGDSPQGPTVSLVTPEFAEPRDITVKVLGGIATMEFQPTPVAHMFQLVAHGIGIDFDSYDAAPSMPTGINRCDLNPLGSPPMGEYNALTGEFELRVEGTLTNNFYPQSRPVLWFATIFGCLDTNLGEAYISCDDPMIAPMPQPVAPGQPKLMGAHVLSFDANTNQLVLLENTTLQPGADIAMTRQQNGNYMYDPSFDNMIGASLLVDPLQLTGQPQPGVFEFADTPIQIDLNNTIVCSGFLRSPTLSVHTGSFMAQWDILNGTPSISPTLDELLNTPGVDKLFQIAVGPAAYDIITITNNFTTSAQLPFPETFHIGVPPCQGIVRTSGEGCLNGPAGSGDIVRMTFDGCPDLGQNMFIGVDGDPLQLTFVVMGISDTNWLGLPLPFPLDPLGAPSCHFYTDHGLVLPLPGLAPAPLPIPPDPRLAGLELHWQGMVLAPSANALGLATTDLLTTEFK